MFPIEQVFFEAEDTVSAVFQFEKGLSGSASWSFTAHESAKEDSIEIYGTAGRIIFSVYNYMPIELYTSQGMQYIDIKNPHYVQEPLIRSIVQDLQGYGKCECTSVKLPLLIGLWIEYWANINFKDKISKVSVAINIVVSKIKIYV